MSNHTMIALRREQVKISMKIQVAHGGRQFADDIIKLFLSGKVVVF